MTVVGTHTSDEIAAMQAKARLPSVHIDPQDADEYTLCKRLDSPNAEYTAVCRGLPPIYSEGACYILVDWYDHAGMIAEGVYEDVETLEIAPAATPYPEGVIPF